MSFNIKHIGKLLYWGGYVVILVSLITISYNLEYQKAAKNVSILNLDFSQFYDDVLIIYAVYISIIMIIVGWLIQYDQRFKKTFRIIVQILHRSWKYKLELIIRLCFFALFAIEVTLSILLINLIIFWKHANEKINVPFAIAIILAIIITSHLDKKIRNKFKIN